MSTKWLKREGESWVRDGLITEEQWERILSRYEPERRSVGMLTILGGLFLGLSVLSFVAANWQLIPNLARLALILLLILLCYVLGWRLTERGSHTLGIAVISIGFLAFGGGIVLIGQMFHLIHFSAFPLVVWGIAGAALTYLFRSRYLFILTLIVLTAAQSYSLSAFGSMNLLGLAVLAAGLIPYVLLRRSPAAAALWSVAVLIHSIMLTASEGWNPGWLFVVVLLLYTAGDFLMERSERIALRLPPLAAAYLFALASALFSWDGDFHWAEHFFVHPGIYGPIFVVLLAVSLVMKDRRKELGSGIDWILLMPLFYLPSAAIPFAYLLILFLYSLLTLLQGYALESRRRINAGTGLFLIATMAAYFKLTWAFLDKSLFFLIGGALLLSLSWLLNRRKQAVLDPNKEA